MPDLGSIRLVGGIFRRSKVEFECASIDEPMHTNNLGHRCAPLSIDARIHLKIGKIFLRDVIILCNGPEQLCGERRL